MKLVGLHRRNLPIRALEIEIDQYETGGGHREGTFLLEH